MRLAVAVLRGGGLERVVRQQPASHAQRDRNIGGHQLDCEGSKEIKKAFGKGWEESGG